MDRIVLKNMVFYGYHGNMPSENTLGQRFYVDVAMHLDLSSAGKSDCIQDTVNYAEVYELVKEIMCGNVYCLLEKLGACICEKIQEKFPLVCGVSVTIRKPSVPISGVLDYAEITINRGQL